jgi:hypothetical protein
MKVQRERERERGGERKGGRKRERLSKLYGIFCK